MKNVSVLIMAGGKSERMNSPKPFLLIEGKTFLETIIEGYLRFGVKHVGVVLNHHLIKHISESNDQIKVIANLHPEYGRLYSLQTGLKNSIGSDFVFIHNVDNPFVDQIVLKEIWNNRAREKFVVPTYRGEGGHPILISKKIANHILSIENASFTLRDALRQYKRIEVKVDSKKILANINTWQEYEEQVLHLIPEYSCD